MRRLGLAVVLTISRLLAPLPGAAQQAGKVWRIGWLHPGVPPAPFPSPTARALLQALSDLGYVAGQNLFVEYRYAAGSEERLQQMATDLVRLRVDLIVAWNTPGTRAAQYATRTIPIVMMNVVDPIEQGLVASLTRPGGNTTGFSPMRTELVGKQLELLKETVPQSRRIAVLGGPTQSYKRLLQQLMMKATELGLQLHPVELRRAEELDTAFAAMTQAGANALIVLADPQLINPLRTRIVDLAAKSRLPAMYNWKTDTDAGGLMSYGPSEPEQVKYLAFYVDKILKGAKPAELPIHQPTKFELVINLKTAKALGLTIPQSILVRADEIIQ